MKLNNKLKNFGAVPVAMFLIFLGTSCEQEPEKPVLPPVSSIIMDFSDFNTQPAVSKHTDLSYKNFLYAYANVALWNTIVTVNLALPVTAYSYALNQDPVYLGDYTWEWSFNFNWNQATYTATLTTERLNNQEFSVDMSIKLAADAGKGPTWFDGVVRYDHTHASWNMYKNANNMQVKILEADWNMDYETEAGNMKYTYVETGQVETGSYVYFEFFTPDPVELDAAYTISLAAGDIFIEWNRITKAGRVMSTMFFEDELWHCWNENLMDVECGLE